MGVFLGRSILQFYRRCAGRVYSRTEGGYFLNSYFGLWWLLVCQSLSVGLFLDWSNLQFYLDVLEESILALRGDFLKIHFFGLQWLCQSPILTDLFLDCSTLHGRVHFCTRKGDFFKFSFGRVMIQNSIFSGSVFRLVYHTFSCTGTFFAKFNFGFGFLFKRPRFQCESFWIGLLCKFT